MENESYTDDQLITLTAQGDEKAFEQLIKKYQQAVFSIIYRYTNNDACLEDLAQEIFIKIWQNAAKFEGKSEFSTWLYRITVNHCLSYNYKHKRNTVSLNQLSNQESMHESLVVRLNWDDRQQSEQVKKAISELPARQRIALVLAHYEGKSHGEIADIMKISISSVHSLIFRARCTLKRKLRKLTA